MRRKVFISDSHEDARWLARVREQLAVLEGEQLIALFDDSRIGAGEDGFERLATELREARLALLLVSAAFLNSDFIHREELPRLLAEQQRAGLLLPVLLRDCAWQEVPWLARLQLRPRDAQPLARLKGNALDRALADVAREVAALARQAEPVPPAADNSVPAAHGWGHHGALGHDPPRLGHRQPAPHRARTVEVHRPAGQGAGATRLWRQQEPGGAAPRAGAADAER